MYTFNGVPGQYFFVEYIINTLQYGHVHLVSFVYFVNALRAEISFGNHFHFHFCGTDGVTTSYHGTEIVIAAEPGIGGNQKVSQIYRVADVSVPAWGDRL